MGGKTVVLRKGGRWYIINSGGGDEREIVLSLIEHSENKTYDVGREEVFGLCGRLGWQIRIFDTQKVA